MSSLSLFVVYLVTIEGTINVEEKFEDQIPYNVDAVFKRAQYVLDQVQKPIWGFKTLNKEDQEAFWDLFDELLERDSVRAHDIPIGKHGVQLAPKMSEHVVLPF